MTPRVATRTPAARIIRTGRDHSIPTHTTYWHRERTYAWARRGERWFSRAVLVIAGLTLVVLASRYGVVWGRGL